MSRLPILLGSSILASLAPISGCNEDSECQTACLRVARCRLEARQGEPMLGEKALPADERCMKRCQNDRDAFDKCELVKRSCEALRSCYGPLR